MEVMTAEQAAEAAKGLTFEKVWAALMETRQHMEESNQRIEESNQRIEESNQRMEESNRRTEDSFRRMEKTVADLSKNIGGFGNQQGRLTEAMFSTNLWSRFNEIGFTFTKQASHTKYKENKNVVAEVDFFLENGEYAMPVEVKTDLSLGDVDEHLERIETIRQYMDKRGDNRKLVGCIAGEIVPENVLKYAQKKGLYVLMQNGESISVATAPEGFKHREWECIAC